MIATIDLETVNLSAGADVEIPAAIRAALAGPDRFVEVLHLAIAYRDMVQVLIEQNACLRDELAGLRDRHRRLVDEVRETRR